MADQDCTGGRDCRKHFSPLIRGDSTSAPTGDDVVSRVTRALMHQSRMTDNAVQRAYMDGYLDGLNGAPPRMEGEQ